MPKEKWSYVAESERGCVFADFNPKTFDDILEVLSRNTDDVVLLFVDPSSTFDIARMLQVFRTMDEHSRMRFHDRIEVAACVVEDSGEEAMLESMKEYVRATFGSGFTASNAVKRGRGTLGLSEDQMFVKGEQP